LQQLVSASDRSSSEIVGQHRVEFVRAGSLVLGGGDGMGEVLLRDGETFFEDIDAASATGRYDGVRGQADEGERYGGEGDGYGEHLRSPHCWHLQAAGHCTEVDDSSETAPNITSPLLAQPSSGPGPKASLSRGG
jgi:hypothetical protein